MKKLISLILLMFAFMLNAGIFTEIYGSVSSMAQAYEVKQVHALHILVPTEEEAAGIRKEILNEKDNPGVLGNFMEAARKYSKCPSGSAGGDLGWFRKGDMVPEFEKTAFEIPIGEVSQPVKTQFGWHLIYVIAKR